MTKEKLTGMIDHTMLKQHVGNEELTRHCEVAKRYNFKTLVAHNSAIPFCRDFLKETDINFCSVVSFPMGQSTTETKVFETIDTIRLGVSEIDYVVNITQIKNNNRRYTEEEMRRIVAACKEHGAVSKVIFETCFLTDDEKRWLCEIALKVEPTFIKTSTGLATGGATLDDVRLMKACVGDSIGVKASGGIRTAEQALMFIEAGATRIGTSNGGEIIDQFAQLTL